MFSVYFDESSKHGTFALSGFVAEDNDWEKFSSRWRKVLQARPPIRRFKAAEANGRKGQFRNYTIEMRDERFAALVEVIANLPRFQVACVIDEQQLATFASASSVTKFARNPYVAALFYITRGVGIHKPNMQLAGEVRFVFDRQVMFEARILKAWPKFQELVTKEYPVPIPASPIFMEDDDCPPLQAADLLAWVVREEATKRRQGDRSPAELTFAPSKPSDSVAFYLDESELAAMYPPVR